MSDFFVRFGLLGLQLGTHIFTHVNVGDVDGENFKGGASIHAFVQNELGDAVRVFEHGFVGIRGADAGDDAFPHTGDDSFLRGTADKAVEIRAHRDAGTHTEGDAIFGDGVDFATTAHVRVRAVDDLWIDAGAHGFEDGLAGAFASEVDGAGAVVVERDARFVRRDEGEHDVRHLTTGQEVRFELVGIDGDTGFGGGDACIDDEGVRHASQPHGEQRGETHRRIRNASAEPEIEKLRDEEEENKGDDNGDANTEDFERFHGRWEGGWRSSGGVLRTSRVKIWTQIARTSSEPNSAAMTSTLAPAGA